MATITKGAAGLVLTTGGNWVGGVAPGAADVARWASTSGPATGNLTGSLTILGLQIDGALGDLVYTSGTLTLTQTDAFTNGASNNRRFTFNGGVMALGSANRNLTLVHTAGGYCLDFATAGAITGSGIVSLINGLANGNNANAYIGSAFGHTGFTGTIRFTDGTGIYSGAPSTGCFSAADIIIDGPNCILSVGVSGAGIGGSGKTLTINNNVTLGRSGFTTQINPNVVLGAVTRTLTVAGNTDITGTVSGSAGVSLNVTDATVNSRIRFAGASNGLTGPCTVGGNRAAFVGATTSVRYAPSTLTINTGGEFNYVNVTQDFTFPVAPTGVGAISIVGSFAGDGCTFSAGLLDSYSGRLVAWPGTTTSSDNLVKLIIHQVPAGGLEWRGNAAASNSMVGRITYANAANLVTSAPLLIDTYVNTTPASLTGGEFSLIVPSTSGTFQCSGTVTRENSIATASARMNLTLGGTNTGDNTLSGDISEVGTNGAILGITKQDAGRWVLSGANSSHTGIHTISAGTLSAQSAKALGSATSAGGVTISGSGALELAGSITLDKSVTDFTVSNATNPIQSVGTNQLLTKQLTLSTTPTLTITSGNKLTLSPQGAGVIAGANGITKAGDGELELTAKANTFSGTLTVSAGTLTVASVANSGVAAAWGQASSAVLVSGALKYTGGAASTTRGVQMTGAAPTINASGTGALVLNSVTQDTNAKTMTLRGTNTDANTISSLIANNSGAVSLAKEDAGKWVLNGGLAHTGTTAVNGGTLRVEVGNNNTASGAVTIGASGTVELITDTLASSGGSAGEVLGTGNVTVNGGTIKTRGGTTQKGQVRYGGNLTFGSGSTLYIGAAA